MLCIPFPCHAGCAHMHTAKPEIPPTPDTGARARVRAYAHADGAIPSARVQYSDPPPQEPLVGSHSSSSTSAMAILLDRPDRVTVNFSPAASGRVRRSWPLKSTFLPPTIHCDAGAGEGIGKRVKEGGQAVTKKKEESTSHHSSQPEKRAEQTRQASVVRQWVSQETECRTWRVRRTMQADIARRDALQCSPRPTPPRALRGGSRTSRCPLFW